MMKLPANGEYVEPSRWSILQVHAYCELGSSDVYMKRLKLIDTPWFGIYIHRIYAPDAKTYPLHDHPWSFISFILTGDYMETLNDETFKFRKRFSLHRMKFTDSHKILSLFGHTVTTFVIRGPIRQKWGFFTKFGREEAVDFFRAERYFVDEHI